MGIIGAGVQDACLNKHVTKTQLEDGPCSSLQLNATRLLCVRTS